MFTETYRYAFLKYIIFSINVSFFYNYCCSLNNNGLKSITPNWQEKKAQKLFSVQQSLEFLKKGFISFFFTKCTHETFCVLWSLIVSFVACLKEAWQSLGCGPQKAVWEILNHKSYFWIVRDFKDASIPSELGFLGKKSLDLSIKSETYGLMHQLCIRESSSTPADFCSFSGFKGDIHCSSLVFLSILIFFAAHILVKMHRQNKAKVLITQTDAAVWWLLPLQRLWKIWLKAAILARFVHTELLSGYNNYYMEKPHTI